jgi:predicted dehydrogenase
MQSSKPISVAVVGYGYWGPNLVRNLNKIEDAHVAYICDADDKRLARARRHHSNVPLTAALDDVLSDPSVQLVALATPVSTHYPLAMQALHAGKHVLIEKPLALGRDMSEKILQAAAEANKQVFVDHTFVFTPAVNKMREVFEKGDLGSLLYYDSVRINLGIFRHDVNVVWDLATHDLAILDFVLRGKVPRWVSCTGMAHFGGAVADLAYLTLKYDNDFMAHIHVNWLAPVKVRQVLLCGDRQMLIYDDNSASEKIKIYNSGVEMTKVEDIYRALVQYRTGDMSAPHIGSSEALELELENVIACLKGRAVPVCDGESGLRVVTVLEAADASLKLGGRPIEIQYHTHPAASSWLNQRVELVPA